MFQRGWFHIDVARSELLPELSRVAMQYGPTRVGPLSAQCLGELAQNGRFAGLIVELTPASAPWLDHALTSVPGLPILVLLEEDHPRAHIDRLHARGASTAFIPLRTPNLVGFVQRALANSFLPCERVARTIAQLAEAHALTAREVQLLSFCMGDEPRSLVRRRLGITENTLKTQIRGLLRKLGERNLDALAKNVLKSALLTPASASRDGAEVTQPLLPLPVAV